MTRGTQRQLDSISVPPIEQTEKVNSLVSCSERQSEASLIDLFISFVGVKSQWGLLRNSFWAEDVRRSEVDVSSRQPKSTPHTHSLLNGKPEMSNPPRRRCPQGNAFLKCFLCAEREVRISSVVTPLKSTSQGRAGKVTEDQERSPEMPRVYSEPLRACRDPELVLQPFSFLLRFPFLVVANGVGVKRKCCWSWRGRVFVHGPCMERLKAWPCRQIERGWWWRGKQRDVRMTNWSHASRCLKMWRE
ncbi:uncharacterized [Tachysurus ichikawai]